MPISSTRVRAVGQPGQDLDQLELVVEVVLEPQDDRLGVRDRGARRSSRARSSASTAARLGAAERREELRAHRAAARRRE